MRKLLVIGAGLVMWLAASAPAGTQTVANPSVRQAGVGDDAYGAGVALTAAGKTHFALAAHERPTGDFGHAIITVTTPTQRVFYWVNLTCVHIHLFRGIPGDKRALIQGVVRRVRPVPNVLGITVGTKWLIGIRDGGTPSATTPVDFFADLKDFTPPNTCHNAQLGTSPPNVERGDVKIKLLD